MADDPNMAGGSISRNAGSRRAAVPAPDPGLTAPMVPAIAGSFQTQAAGDRIGPYRLLELIGEGGFGEVWLAQQTEPIARRVALKVIKAGMDSRAVIARFEQERQALAVMDHPNIAKVHDAGTTPQGRPYFVMEHVKGAPITEYCDTQRLTVAQRLRLFETVCDAVQHAHMKGIIHRDLKPSNILVAVAEGGAPRPVVIDFGVAKAIAHRLTEKTIFTEQGQLIGTPEYMSPEQAEMAETDIDTRTDVYALGVVLYELLTGALPFDPRSVRGAGYAAIQKMIREVPPPRPSTRLSSMHDRGASAAEARRARLADLAAQLRSELEWIPLKALRKDRTERYRSAAELGDDIANYVASRPLIAGPESAPYRLRKFVHRNRAPVLAGGAVVAALVLGLGVALWAAGVAARERDAADRARRAATGQRTVAELRAQEALEAKAQAEERQKETEQVAKFQASQLKDIDAALMGSRLRDDLIADARAALERAGLNAEEITARQGEFEKQLAGINFTTVALKTLDQSIFGRALTAIDEQFKDQALVRASLLQTLADTVRDLGLLDRATAPQTAALDIHRRVLGNDDPRTLVSIASMGVLLQAQGKFSQAEPYYREALERHRRVLGDDHAGTLNAINNMGFLLQSQGKLSEAEPYYREALERKRRTLGDDNPETLLSINNMGFLLQAQRKLDEAEPYFRQALDGYRRMLGSNDPDTISAINNLGFVLQLQGKLSEAEPLLREALEQSRRVRGDDHPETITTINNMGLLLRARDRPADAEPLLREALERSRRVLGEDHPDTKASIRNMAVLLEELGRLAEAQPYYGEWVAGVVREYGSDHWQTGMARLGYGLALSRLERLPDWQRELLEAERVLRIAPGTPPALYKKCVEMIAALYSAWDKAEPGKGHDAQATEWWAKYNSLARPAVEQTTDGKK